MMADPFTMVTQAIWQALEQDPDISSGVRPGNRIKRLETGEATQVMTPKEEIISGDLPELDIVPAGGSVKFPASAGAFTVTQDFEIVINVEDARLDLRYYPLWWAIIRAMMKHGGCNLGLDFVERVSFGSYTNEESNDALLRGIDGWSALLTATVVMRFNVKEI